MSGQFTHPIRFPLLSIDPSSTHVGWCVIGPGPSYIASSVYQPPGMDADERIIAVGNFITDLLNHYRPGAILIEMPDYIDPNANPQNLIKLFRAVGAAEYAASRMGAAIHREKASKYKLMTCKMDRMQRFRNILGKPPITHDESDAFCFGWDFVLEHTSICRHAVPPL